MKKRLLPFLSFLIFLSCESFREQGLNEIENVVFLIGDDHSYEVLGCYGNPLIRTPNLDKMAKEGISFTHAYANSPICSASRQSLLTGKYPHTTGVNLLFTPFNDKINVTVAEYLRENGFNTCVIGKTHFNNWIWSGYYRDGMPDHGFDEIIDGNDYKEYLMEYKEDLLPIDDKIKTWKSGESQSVQHRKNSEVLPQPCLDRDCEGTYYARKAVEYIEKNRMNPFLLWVAFHEPHAPFNFPVDYSGKYDPDQMPLPPGSPEDDQWIPLQFRDLTEEERRGIIASYYTSVEYLDKNVGMILDGLKKNGLEKNTLVIYLGDQGYLLNDHKRFEKHTMWEESIKAPLIIRGGDIISNKTSGALVEFIDIVPTVLEVLDLSIPEYIQGISFLDVLTNKTDHHKEFVFAEFLEDNKAMVASKRWKYIFTTGKRDLGLGYETGNPPAGIYHRLYDLEEDPEETTNLAYLPAHRNIVKEYQEKMLELFQESHPYTAELPPNLNRIGKLVWFCEPRDVGAHPGNGQPERIFENSDNR